MRSETDLRIEQLKNMLISSLAMVLVAQAIILGALDVYTYSIMLLLFAGILIILAWGRYSHGYCRKMATYIPGAEMDEPPLSTWEVEK